MQLTLHLTNQCNLKCKYCFVEHGTERMSREVAFAAIKLGMENTDTSGMLFYGGEPLLERGLIYNVVNHTKAIRKKTGHNFYCYRRTIMPPNRHRKCARTAERKAQEQAK